MNKLGIANPCDERGPYRYFLLMVLTTPIFGRAAFIIGVIMLSHFFFSDKVSAARGYPSDFMIVVFIAKEAENRDI